MAIDPAAIEEYRDVLGDEFAEFFIDLIDSFFVSGPEFIQDMKNALATNDDELFTRSAHTMKSNCKTFGAYEFADKAYQLEKLGASKNFSGVPEMIASLEVAYEDLLVDLHEFLSIR